MRILTFLIVLLLPLAGFTAPLESAALQMPKELLGEWFPRSNDYNSIEIKPTEMVRQYYFVDSGKKQFTAKIEYKILKIEDGNVFLIAREQIDPSMKKKYPNYDYSVDYNYITLLMYHRSTFGIKRTVLQVSTVSTYDHPTEKDWNSPLVAIQNNLEKELEKHRFSSHIYYAKP